MKFSLSIRGLTVQQSAVIFEQTSRPKHQRPEEQWCITHPTVLYKDICRTDSLNTHKKLSFRMIEIDVSAYFLLTKEKKVCLWSNWAVRVFVPASQTFIQLTNLNKPLCENNATVFHSNTVLFKVELRTDHNKKKQEVVKWDWLWCYLI